MYNQADMASSADSANWPLSLSRFLGQCNFQENPPKTYPGHLLVTCHQNTLSVVHASTTPRQLLELVSISQAHARHKLYTVCICTFNTVAYHCYCKDDSLTETGLEYQSAGCSTRTYLECQHASLL